MAIIPRLLTISTLVARVRRTTRPMKSNIDLRGESSIQSDGGLDQPVNISPAWSLGLSFRIKQKAGDILARPGAGMFYDFGRSESPKEQILRSSHIISAKSRSDDYVVPHEQCLFLTTRLRLVRHGWIVG